MQWESARCSRSRSARVARLGPDLLADDTRLWPSSRACALADPSLLAAQALVDQRLVAGIVTRGLPRPFWHTVHPPPAAPAVSHEELADGARLGP